MHLLAETKTSSITLYILRLLCNWSFNIFSIQNTIHCTVFFVCAHRAEVMPTEEKILQALKLTTDIQWLKIHGENWKKNIKRVTSGIK